MSLPNRPHRYLAPQGKDHSVECEVCGEIYENENNARRHTTVTWIKDAQGRDEGIDHCKTCLPQPANKGEANVP